MRAMKRQEPQRHLTPPPAAKRLHVAEETVRAWIVAGELPAANLPGAAACGHATGSTRRTWPRSWPLAVRMRHRSLQVVSAADDRRKG